MVGRHRRGDRRPGEVDRRAAGRRLGLAAGALRPEETGGRRRRRGGGRKRRRLSRDRAARPGPGPAGGELRLGGHALPPALAGATTVLRSAVSPLVLGVLLIAAVTGPPKRSVAE